MWRQLILREELSGKPHLRWASDYGSAMSANRFESGGESQADGGQRYKSSCSWRDVDGLESSSTPTVCRACLEVEFFGSDGQYARRVPKECD